MASSPVILKHACVVVLTCMVVCSPFAESAITCGVVVSKLTPCLSYLRNGGPVPAACCNGVRGLNAEAKSTPDRQVACGCMKKAASGIAGIQPAFATSLPSKCGVSIPYQISPSIDCSKVK